MKNLLILFLLAAGLTSCSKDSLDPVTENYSIDKSEVFVRVTYMTWSDLACDLTCSGEGSQYINAMPNAKVEIYSGNGQGVDDVISDLNGLTGTDGSAIFKDIDPGQYTIIVDTPLGQKTRTVYTQLHKRTSIEFSF
jgi:hypothetical protein